MSLNQPDHLEAIEPLVHSLKIWVSFFKFRCNESPLTTSKTTNYATHVSLSSLDHLVRIQSSFPNAEYIPSLYSANPINTLITDIIKQTNKQQKEWRGKPKTEEKMDKKIYCRVCSKLVMNIFRAYATKKTLNSTFNLHLPIVVRSFSDYINYFNTK